MSVTPALLILTNTTSLPSLSDTVTVAEQQMIPSTVSSSIIACCQRMFSRPFHTISLLPISSNEQIQCKNQTESMPTDCYQVTTRHTFCRLGLHVRSSPVVASYTAFTAHVWKDGNAATKHASEHFSFLPLLMPPRCKEDFPFLAPPMYDYLCARQMSSIEVTYRTKCRGTQFDGEGITIFPQPDHN